LLEPGDGDGATPSAGGHRPRRSRASPRNHGPPLCAGPRRPPPSFCGCGGLRRLARGPRAGAATASPWRDGSRSPVVVQRGGRGRASCKARALARRHRNCASPHRPADPLRQFAKLLANAVAARLLWAGHAHALFAHPPARRVHQQRGRVAAAPAFHGSPTISVALV
jgi:hypothetical protein